MSKVKSKLNFIVFTFSLTVLGCVSSQIKTQSFNEKTVEILVNYLILEGDLDKQAFLVNRTWPFQYFEIKFTDDGLQIPPPNYYSRNESEIVNLIDLKCFPKDDSTLEFVKNQLKASSSRQVLNFGEKSIKPNQIEHKRPYYKVYKPIYNVDSTAIYLEIDFHHQIYGDGRAFVFEFKNGNWKNVKFIPTWTR